MSRLIIHALFALVLGLGVLSDSHADAEGLRVEKLSYIDRQFLDSQRARINDLSQREFGQSFSGNKALDLALLQRILDARLLKPSQTLELQAMGVIMGDLLADELHLEWVIYEDKKGRSRALKGDQSDSYLFPITMISRRAEVGNTTPVKDIYAKAVRAIEAARPAKPYTYEK
ncbi:MAG: dihydrodipicolinate synthase [Gammaproteobacteria bacterium]|nr:MAG: dihydrodipicolinate synthase [Gammaproteobacteria bacterium]